jgi:DNA-binding transcriptional regulator YhcF (GntR family)
MQIQWQTDQPIYRQLRERVVQMILDGLLAEGEALPGVRKVAAELQLNPLTVMKGYQELVEEEIVEKKRGLGMFVKEGGARAAAGQRAGTLPGGGVAPHPGPYHPAGPAARPVAGGQPGR